MEFPGIPLKEICEAQLHVEEVVMKTDSTPLFTSGSQKDTSNCRISGRRKVANTFLTASSNENLSLNALIEKEKLP